MDGLQAAHFFDQGNIYIFTRDDLKTIPQAKIIKPVMEMVEGVYDIEVEKYAVSLRVGLLFTPQEALPEVLNVFLELTGINANTKISTEQMVKRTMSPLDDDLAGDLDLSMFQEDGMVKA